MKNQLSTITDGYRKRQRRYVFTALTLLFLTFALACIMMIYGNTIYSPKAVLKVLSGEDVEGAVFTIRTLRLPRMLTAILCGLAFGMAGNTFQQLLGNPLASPDIIGVTSGASVAAVFGILVLKLNGGTVSLMAVFSGLLVSVLIYFLSQGGGFSNARLILTGIGMQAFLSAVISWMLLKASEYDVANALRWLSGSLNGVKLENVPSEPDEKTESAFSGMDSDEDDPTEACIFYDEEDSPEGSEEDPSEAEGAADASLQGSGDSETEAKVCPNCGFENTADCTFCERCGSKL